MVVERNYMYIFSEYEWSLLIKMFENYENILPIILQDFMNAFFSNHRIDKKIKSESELLQILEFLEIIYEEINTDKKKEFENGENSTDIIRVEDIIELKNILNEIVIIVSVKRNEELQNSEDRDEYK